ncbi:MAG: hypothetical protein KatS3mg091_078 [Patescibacteria group bacterium]|nr:MAG: hypothetical protein KatS3mg091_078 [Patescibacteria group bacterium]
MKKLNLGCGQDYKIGWVNVDADHNVKADLYFDVAKKFPLKDESFDYILAQDVLEHLTFQQAKIFLSECKRVLRVNGVLEIRVPNLFDIFKRFKSDPEVLFKFIYGNTESHSIYGLHKYGYTLNTLKKHLALAGFKVIESKYKTTNLIVKSKKIKFPKLKFRLVISLLDSGGYGGSEMFLLSLAKEINQSYKVQFLTLNNHLINSKLKSNKIKFTSIGFRNDLIGGFKGLIKFFLLLPYSIFSYLNILKELKNNGYQSILLPGFTDKILITPLAKLLGFDVIWLQYAPLGDLLKKFFYLPKVLYRISVRFVDLLVCPTNYAKTKIIPELRLSESKIRQIPCGTVLLSRVQKKSYLSKRETLRKKLNLKGFVAGCVSRLDKDKGQDVLIKSAVYLKRKLPEFTIVIVGQGGQEVYLKSLVNKLGLQQYVRFTEFYEDVYEILSCFDLFVFPTRWGLEGFGLAPFEAVAVGIPVILADHPVLREIWKNQDWFFKPTPKILAKKIYQIYNLDKQEIIVQQKQLLRQYDIKKISKLYLEELLNLAKIRSILIKAYKVKL